MIKLLIINQDITNDKAKRKDISHIYHFLLFKM